MGIGFDMGRKKKSNISSTGSRNGSISHIPYFGISYSFEDMKDFTDSEEIEHETPSISSEPSAGPESSSPRSLSPKHIPLSIIAPPITPLSSKRKNSVHFKHRKSTTIDLLLNSSSSLEPKQHSVSPISPEYLKSNSVSSHFSLKSPSLSKSSSISSRTSRTSIPPELECAEYMEVPKVSSNITKGN